MRDRQRGFTLIELLVVTAILVVVAIVVGACLAGGVRAWDKARSFSRVETDIVVGLSIIGRDLRNTAPFDEIAFAGDDSGFSLPTLLDLGTAEADSRFKIGTVKYFITDGQQKIVRRKAWAYPGAEPPFEESDVVMSGVESVHLQYYRAPQAGAKNGVWQDVWNSPTNMPACVKIELKVSGDTAGIDVKRTIVVPVRNVY